MESWGNSRANAYYEGSLPSPDMKPTERDSVDVVTRYIKGDDPANSLTSFIVLNTCRCNNFVCIFFVQDKYVHKKYMATVVPPPNTFNGVKKVAAATVVSTEENHNSCAHKNPEQVSKLHELKTSDQLANPPKPPKPQKKQKNSNNHGQHHPKHTYHNMKQNHDQPSTSQSGKLDPLIRSVHLNVSIYLE
mgnify:CR=1 FL=1